MLKWEGRGIRVGAGTMDLRPADLVRFHFPPGP